MSFINTTPEFPLPMLHVNAALEKNPHPEPKGHSWELIVEALTPEEEKDPKWMRKTRKQNAQKALEAIKERINRFDFDRQLSKLVNRHRCYRKAQVLAYFDPNVRHQVSKILSDFENTRVWLVEEQREPSVIDASALTKEERSHVAFRSAQCKAAYITRTIMPWKEVLDRVHLKNYGVDLNEIPPYFEQTSRERVKEALLDDQPFWESYRADILKILDGPPDGYGNQDPTIAACNLYKDGRRHLNECFYNLIWNGNIIPDIDNSVTGEDGLLEEGQYTKDHEQFWWIKSDRYRGKASSLRKKYEDLLKLMMERDPTTFPRGQRCKRRYGTVDNERPPKRRKCDDRSPGTSDCMTKGQSQDAASVRAALDKKKLPAPQRGRGTKPRNNSSSSASLSNNKPRCSTRIANRQQLHTTMTHTRVPKRTQMPTPPSSPEIQGQKARALVRRAANGGCSTRNHLRDTSKPQGISKRRRFRS